MELLRQLCSPLVALGWGVVRVSGRGSETEVASEKCGSWEPGCLPAAARLHSLGASPHHRAPAQRVVVRPGRSPGVGSSLELEGSLPLLVTEG